MNWKIYNLSPRITKILWYRPLTGGSNNLTAVALLKVLVIRRRILVDINLAGVLSHDERGFIHEWLMISLQLLYMLPAAIIK